MAYLIMASRIWPGRIWPGELISAHRPDTSTQTFSRQRCRSDQAPAYVGVRALSGFCDPARPLQRAADRPRCHLFQVICIWWRRRESNPRPKSLSTKRGSMLSPVPEVSLYALRTDKMRILLVRGSRPYDPYPAIETSLLCDVPLRPADKATGDGNLFN